MENVQDELLSAIESLVSQIKTLIEKQDLEKASQLLEELERQRSLLLSKQESPDDGAILEVLTSAQNAGQLMGKLQNLEGEIKNIIQDKSINKTNLQIVQDQDHLEKIVGKKANFEPILWLDKALQASKSVCRVVLESGGLGTGFMIPGGYVMTNNHVLANREAAHQAYIEFNYEKDSDGNPKEVKRYDLDASDFVTDAKLDFARVKVKDPNGDLHQWGELTLAPTYKPEMHEPVNIIQHPLGDYKQIALTANEVISNDWQHYLFYNADTQPGSSGSPVFNAQWEVIAIHHAGRLMDENGKGGLQIDAKGTRASANRGIYIQYILDFLKENTEGNQHIQPIAIPTSTTPAPVQARTCKFFLMYDEADRDQVVKLKKHLYLLERKGKIELFDMHNFQVGNRQQKIEEAMDNCHFVIACVTYNFFFSQYDLIESATDKEKPVIVVRINEADMEDSMLEDLYYLPSNGKSISEHSNEDAAYFDVVKNIRRAIKNGC